MIESSQLMRALVLTAMLLCLGGAAARVEPVERTFKGRTGQEYRIGVFASIRSDCKSGRCRPFAPGGKTQLQKITVTVDANPGGEKI